MIRLLEFPDTNFFYYDEPITTVPDFIAISDDKDASITYQIEWWYESNPGSKIVVSGQNLTFSTVSQNIDYRCIITEIIGNQTNTYYSNEILSYYNHIKKLQSEVSGFNVTDLEFYKYSGYTSYDSYTGVENFSSFKEEGISGYSGYSGNYLPVLSIMDSFINRNQKGFDDALFQLNLNPQLNNEEDTLNIFDKYNLNVNCYNQQELFNKIQHFEHENFSNYTQKSAWLRILKPIDDGMTKLNKKIQDGKVIGGLIAGEDLLKHQLVTLIRVSNEDETILKVYKANPYSIEINGITKPRRAYGFVLEDTLENEECEIQIKDKISKFNFWWNPSFDFKNTLGEIYYLYGSGLMSNSDYPIALAEDGLLDVQRPVVFQEIGYPVSDTEFMIKMKLPVIRHILTTDFSDDGGGGDGGGPIPV